MPVVNGRSLLPPISEFIFLCPWPNQITLGYPTATVIAHPSSTVYITVVANNLLGVVGCTHPGEFEPTVANENAMAIISGRTMQSSQRCVYVLALNVWSWIFLLLPVLESLVYTTAVAHKLEPISWERLTCKWQNNFSVSIERRKQKLHAKYWLSDYNQTAVCVHFHWHSSSSVKYTHANTHSHGAHR